MNSSASAEDIGTGFFRIALPPRHFDLLQELLSLYQSAEGINNAILSKL
jgi:hypothetical protein